MKRLPRWAFLLFVAGALVATLVTLRLLGPRASIWPRQDGTYVITWRVLLPAIGLAFGLPVLAGRVLTRPPWWLAVPAIAAAAALAAAVFRRRLLHVGSGATLSTIVFVSACAAGALALALGGELDDAIAS